MSSVMIVIGGGVTEVLGERLLKLIRWYIQKNGTEQVRIVAAELGDSAGVLGVATMAWQKLEG